AGRIGMIAVTLALLGDFSSTTSLSDFPGSFIICAPKEHLKLTKYLVRIPRRGLVRTYPRLAWRLFLGFYSIRDRRSFSRRATFLSKGCALTSARPGVPPTASMARADSAASYNREFRLGAVK